MNKKVMLGIKAGIVLIAIVVILIMVKTKVDGKDVVIRKGYNHTK